MTMWRDKVPKPLPKDGESAPADPEGLVNDVISEANAKAQEQFVREYREKLISRMEFVANAVRGMNRTMQERMDSRRNYKKECGHPETSEIGVSTYQEIYDRDPIGARAIEVWPKECWQMNPIVYESESEDDVTPYEARLREVSKQIGGNNYNNEENLNAINQYLCDLQIKAGIGRFGVLFIGIDDGLDPRFPAAGWKYPDSKADYGEADPDFANYQANQRMVYNYAPAVRPPLPATPATPRALPRDCRQTPTPRPGPTAPPRSSRRTETSSTCASSPKAGPGSSATRRTRHIHVSDSPSSTS
jgi:hypothetical protein